MKQGGVCISHWTIAAVNGRVEKYIFTIQGSSLEHHGSSLIESRAHARRRQTRPSATRGQDVSSKESSAKGRFGQSRCDLRGLGFSRRILPGSPRRQAGERDGDRFCGFDQRVDFHLVVVVPDVHSVRLQ